MRFLLAGATAVLVAGAVYVNIPAEANPADEIEGAPDGQVGTLRVLDDDYERWYVPRVTKVDANGATLTFTYITGRCEKDGLVGYALERASTNAQLTVVAGESGQDCDSVAVPHRAEVELDEPLSGQPILIVEPERGR